MTKILTSTFGANWWTSLWGYIALATAAIALKPDIISFLPDFMEPTIVGISTFITFVSGGVFVAGVKSKNVTGGTVQQTSDGAVASRSSTDNSSAVTETKQAMAKL